MVLVNKVILNPNVVSGKIGQIVYFGYSITPNNATNKGITISSSNPDVVEIFENSFRFKKSGAATITITSNDGGFTESYSCTCENEKDFISTVQELEIRLQQYYDVLKLSLKNEKDQALIEVSAEKMKMISELEKVCSTLVSDVKKIANDNVVIINRELQEAIEALESVTLSSVEEIKNSSSDQLNKISVKLRELTEYMDGIYDKISVHINNAESNVSFYIEEAILKAKSDVNTLVSNTMETIGDKLQSALLAIDKREEFAIINMDNKYTTAIDLIESAEITAIEDIKLVVEDLKLQLHKEVEGIDGIIKGELNKAILEIKTLQENALNEIQKAEMVVKNIIDVELDSAKTQIKNEVENVKNSMFEYMMTLNNMMTEHKNNLMNDIIADKDAILIEFEIEANRLIEIIREKEYELFQDLQAVQQAIINRIQLVTQGYDAQMEDIKNAKILELEQLIQGYDAQIEVARLAATTSITEMGDSYLRDLLNKKNEYEAFLTSLKNQFSDQLTNQYSGHSSSLTSEFNTHRDSLNNQVNNSSTGLKKQLSDDYTTHSTNLLNEKNTYTANLTNTKDAGMNEITNLKNSAMDEIGRNTNSGLWKTVRDSVITTGQDQKTSLTNEGNRLLSLFADIEVNFTALTDAAVERIGTSDSTGLRGEAVVSITSHRTNAEKRIGTSDTAMNGSSASLRKEVVDRIVALSAQKEEEIRATGTDVTDSAYTAMNLEKDKILQSVIAAVTAGEEQMYTAMSNIVTTKNENETAINALHTSTITDIENKRVSSVASVNSTNDSAVSTVNSTRDSAVSRIGTSDSSMNGSSPSVRKDAVDSVLAKKTESLTAIETAKGNAITEITKLTAITAAEVDAIWAGI